LSPREALDKLYELKAKIWYYFIVSYKALFVNICGNITGELLLVG
jgi:hypothetical protein